MTASTGAGHTTACHAQQGDFVTWRGQQMIFLRPRHDRGDGMVQVGFTGHQNRKLRDMIVHRDEISSPVEFRSQIGAPPVTPETHPDLFESLSRGFLMCSRCGPGDHTEADHA